MNHDKPLELDALEAFLNANCRLPERVDFNSPADLEAMATALDILMSACRNLLLRVRARE